MIEFRLIIQRLRIQSKLKIGNLDSKRDWGYAPEYVDAMWRMLQTPKPEDFVIATGETHSIRELIEYAFKLVDIEITWKGSGLNEIGIDRNNNITIIETDQYYYRPTEVDLLVGDSSKASDKLKWKPKVKFKELIEIMIQNEININE